MGIIETFRICSNQYLKKISEAHASLTHKLADLEPLRGSEKFVEEERQAREQHAQALDEARRSFRNSASLCVDRMREQLSERTLEPPTEAQMRLLNALRHREHISESQLDEAARSLRGNTAALELLTEIGERAGSRRRDFAERYSDQVSTAAANALVDNLAAAASGLLESTARPGVYRSALHHFEHHGGDRPEPHKMPQVEPFADCRDFVGRAGLAWSGAQEAREATISNFLKLFN